MSCVLAHVLCVCGEEEALLPTMPQGEGRSSSPPAEEDLPSWAAALVASSPPAQHTCTNLFYSTLV